MRIARLLPLAPWLLVASLTTCITACNGEGADVSEVSYDPYLKVGASAHDLLSAERFRSLTVEIQSVPGFEPLPTTLSNLKSFLEEHLDKPDGVRIITKAFIPHSIDGTERYSPDDVRRLDRENRKTFSQGNQLSAFVLFLDGKSSRDDTVYSTLGQTYWNTSMVIFANNVRRTANTLGGSQHALAIVESVTLLHEFGHVLGLVNNGTSLTTQHLDEAHPAHCNNPRCLMHYSIESGVLERVLGSGEIPELDTACRSDLGANRGN